MNEKHLHELLIQKQTNKQTRNEKAKFLKRGCWPAKAIIDTNTRRRTEKKSKKLPELPGYIYAK